ncbi:putative transcriptional regulatory protein [Pseudocercospora fuligena]|uniref:Putative transcriptional regulatory protein n=1 Tax=Pseudocercospora fuligena TaxID=685502 RepID=A0A8H6RU47_9PEZI|nr:putative transcriptional regulatory protein [Pseudocercospora fuligena]
MGPSAFTENQFKENMLEIEMQRDESPAMTDMSRGDKYALVQLYREASSGILDLFTVAEVHGFLDRHNALSPSNIIDDNDKRTKAEQASLSMMLAIGHQCRGPNPFDSQNATRHFTCAQKWAFEGFLSDPSLDLVRVFLLMAYYMLGACHRNAAFMYLGIATKAACALGLHRKDQHKGLTMQECLVRWRTWKSLLILDTIVSSILGRPGGLPARRPDDSTYDGDEDIGDLDRPRWLASKAVFGVCSHIIELEQQLGNGVISDAATAESFLQRLRTWNDSVPAELRHFASVKDTTLGPADREQFIGSVHVACSYYFTIILVTRPFLISHLVSQIRRRRRPSLDKANQTSAVSDLAQACLDSAVYMAKTGYMGISSAILSNNMCLLKAWMFAAGLLLGFAMFAQTEPVPEVDNAFANSIVVLERLALVSPQARHYYEILSTFSDAVHSRREQLGREKRKKSNQYVSQIFTADFQDPNATLQAAPYTTPSSGGGPANLDTNSGGTTDLDGMVGFDFDASSFGTVNDGLGRFPSHSDDLGNDFLLSDNLYIDWESLWPMDGLTSMM